MYGMMNPLITKKMSTPNRPTLKNSFGNPNGAVGDYNERGRNKPQNLDVIEQLLIRPFGAFYMALGYFRRPALPATAGRFYKRTQDVSGLWVGVRRQDADGRYFLGESL